MAINKFVDCYENSPLLLTEGAVGQRLEREFSLYPDKDIMYAALIYNNKGRKSLETIYRQYLQVAQDYNLPILLMTNTRRANKDRVLKSAYKNKNVMMDYACFLREIVEDYHCDAFIGGMMGCKGDAYSCDEGLSLNESLGFHTWQANMFQNSPIDFMFAGIMPSKIEAMGIAKVMQNVGLPYIISLMISENGNLLDGNSIYDAIESIDGAVKQKPLCYITNCVHPSILRVALSKPFNCKPSVLRRFTGIQANAACFSPEILEDSVSLKTTTPEELTHEFSLLYEQFPMKILGGCCGTDNRHIEEIARKFGIFSQINK